MKPSLRWIAALLLSLAIAVVCGCNREGESGLSPGLVAPQFSLRELKSERTVSLADLRGKVILLNFWASWCTPCIGEMPELEKLQAQLGTEKFVVVAVGVDDTPERLSEVVSRLGVSFPVLIDSTSSVARTKYKLGGLPESFVINSLGRLIMVVDPESGEPTLRIIGPRNWTTPEWIGQFKTLMESQN